MTTDGNYGSCPDWYVLLKDAEYLRVAPWDLLEVPIVWQDWARMARNAEYEAQRQKAAVKGG